VRSSSEPGFRRAQAPLWAALLLGAAFLLLGLGFCIAPGPGAWLFGIEAADRTALAYVRALGFRDIALSFYIFGLLRHRGRRALSVVLAASIVIPACDIALVAALSGTTSAGSLMLHLAAAMVLVAVALWLRVSRS
jgi:hypothetical protein